MGAGGSSDSSARGHEHSRAEDLIDGRHGPSNHARSASGDGDNQCEYSTTKPLQELSKLCGKEKFLHIYNAGNSSSRWTDFSNADYWDGTKVERNTLSSLDLVKDILHEINMVRQYPHQYAEYILKPMLNKYVKRDFDGRTVTVYREEGKTDRVSHEGTKPVQEVIDILQDPEFEPRPALTINSKLCEAALDHVEDIGPVGKLKNKHYGTGTETDLGKHTTNGPSHPAHRINRYFESDILTSEAIASGVYSGRRIVKSLLIDDNYKSRDHRKTILKPCIVSLGAASGCYNQDRYEKVLCVIDYKSVAPRSKVDEFSITLPSETDEELLHLSNWDIVTMALDEQGIALPERFQKKISEELKEWDGEPMTIEYYPNHEPNMTHTVKFKLPWKHFKKSWTGK